MQMVLGAHVRLLKMDNLLWYAKRHRPAITLYSPQYATGAAALRVPLEERSVYSDRAGSGVLRC